MKKKTQKHILAQIQENFKTFGAGQQFPGANMTALALEDGPLVFAAGVDVAEVVALVIRESRHQELVDAIKEAILMLETGQSVQAEACGTSDALLELKPALALAHNLSTKDSLTG